MKPQLPELANELARIRLVEQGPALGEVERHCCLLILFKRVDPILHLGFEFHLTPIHNTDVMRAQVPTGDAAPTQAQNLVMVVLRLALPQGRMSSLRRARTLATRSPCLTNVAAEPGAREPTAMSPERSQSVASNEIRHLGEIERETETLRDRCGD